MVTKLLGFALAAVLSGCTTPPSGVDQQFGSAVRNCIAQQTLNPAASTTTHAMSVMDGQVAKSAIDRYQKSFQAPPAPTNVLNIGLGSGSNNSTGR
jgi:hypothetical protein